MTLHDGMNHYGSLKRMVQTRPPLCPKCGSHRTEIVGTTDKGALIIRCNMCGERSTMTSAPTASVPLDDVAAEVSALEIVGQALAQLSDADARRRVIQWACDRFQLRAPQAGSTAASHDDVTVPAMIKAPDPNLTLDGVALFEDTQADIYQQEPTPQPASGLESLVRGFVTDLDPPSALKALQRNGKGDHYTLKVVQHRGLRVFKRIA